MNQHWKKFKEAATGKEVVLDMREVAMFSGDRDQGYVHTQVTLKGGATVSLEISVADFDAAVVDARQTAARQ